MVCATMGNIHREQDREPYTPVDFMPYLEKEPEPEPEPEFVPFDPEAHSRLIMAAVFGKTD